MHVLALSGSLRAASINSALLPTAARLAPPEVEVTICSVIGDLPLFNPDLDAQQFAAVQHLHQQVAQADALLIASPEYAHGVTGAIKNALDWLVACEAFVNKPVAVLNASPRAHIAEADMASTPAIAHAIREVLAALYGAVVLRQAEGGPAFPVRA